MNDQIKRLSALKGTRLKTTNIPEQPDRLYHCTIRSDDPDLCFQGLLKSNHESFFLSWGMSENLIGLIERVILNKCHLLIRSELESVFARHSR